MLELPPVPLRPAPLDLPFQLHVGVRGLGRHLSAAPGRARPATPAPPGGESPAVTTGARAWPRFRAAPEG